MLNFHIKTTLDKYVIVSLSSKFPPATKQSEKAKRAMVADMVSKGALPELAEQQAHGYMTLFPDGTLKAIKTPFYAFDTLMRRMTIAWLGSGTRLLAIGQLDTLEQRFAAAQLKILPLWADFKASYSAKIAELERDGGQYFDRSAYPDPESLDHYFKFELTITPIADPNAFDMGCLSQNQADALKDRLQEAMRQAAADATREYAKKLADQLAKITKGMAIEKVDGKHTRFAASTLDNLKDLLAADLNIADDPALEAALSGCHRAVRETENAVKSQRESDKQFAAATAAQAASKLAGLF